MPKPIRGNDDASLARHWCEGFSAFAMKLTCRAMFECRSNNSPHIRSKAHARFDGMLHKGCVHCRPRYRQPLRHRHA